MDRETDPAILVRSLAATVTRIQAAVRSLSARQLSSPPARGEWSPNELLWHIRATADVYGEHIARILDEDEPSWRHISPRARMKKARYDEVPFAESFTAFRRQRKELLSRLGSIEPSAWQRFARIRVRDRDSKSTLHERVWRMAEHEEIHCVQMERTAETLRAGAR